MDWKFTEVLDQVVAAGQALLSRRPPRPSSRSCAYWKKRGQAALDTWRTRDGAHLAATCARCRRSPWIISDILSIAKTGMCGFCSLPEVT